MARYVACPVPGCGRFPHPRSRHCYRHTVRSSRYGSPTGRPVPIRSLQDYFRTAEGFVHEYRDRAPTRAAVQLCDAEVLNLKARTPIRFEIEAEYAMELLRSYGITAEALLVRVVGFYLYSERHPWKTQREEDVACGRAVAHAVPYGAGAKQPNGPAMAHLGTVVRTALMPYSLALIRKVEQVAAERRALVAASASFDEPPSTTGDPA